MSNIGVSVIVPVYNVEKYLDKCINSILNQSYKNYEVILIDDGSTDESGKICDKYTSKYKFIRAIHKENGGQSHARNLGVVNSKYQYVTFIDSDDYIDRYFLERLTDILEGYESDIAICGILDEDTNGNYIYPDTSSGEVKVYSNYEAIEEMCYERKFGTSPCAKVIKKKIVLDNPFPIGVIYEDLATLYKILGDCNSIVFYDKKMYHYVHHFGSTTKNIWHDNVMYVMKASNELLHYIETRCPNIIDAGVQRYFFSANEVYVRSFDERKYLSIIYDIRQQLKKYWPYIVANNKIAFKQKLRYWMMMDFPMLYKYIWKIKYII